MTTPPFAPGDIIVRRNAAGEVSARFVVMDPPHSASGKLRLLRERQGTELRTWWTPDWLPWRHERLAVVSQDVGHTNHGRPFGG